MTPDFPLACNLATPCLSREPKARVATNWDEHLHSVMFTYKIAFKVSTSHTTFQLVYGLHALMPTEYLLPMANFSTSKDFVMTKVFNTQLSKLEKLEESRTLAVETIGM
jgi:hypothetical protein